MQFSELYGMSVLESEIWLLLVKFMTIYLQILVNVRQ